MKKLGLTVLLTVFILVFMGCTSLNEISVSAAHESLEEGEWGTPETHTLLFGVEGPDVHLTSIMLQQNPKFGYDFFRPYKIESQKTVLYFINVGKNRFFIYPHPVGSEFKEFSWYTISYSANYTSKNTYIEGIAGVDIALVKPGLQYYGADNKKHSQELKTLKKVYKYFKGSEWEKVIQARIEEITNGN